MVEATMSSNHTVAAQLAAAFKRHGVTLAFGQSMPTAFYLVAPQFGIKQATYRTENAGGAMADAYARISNRVSVVSAQNGPAATLLVPPLAEAMKASVPIIALVQEVPRVKPTRTRFRSLTISACSTLWRSGSAGSTTLAGWTTMSIWPLSMPRPAARGRWCCSYRSMC